MRILIFLFAFIIASKGAANPVDQGIKLIYQGKTGEALKVLEPLAQKQQPKAAFFSALLLLFGDKPEPSKGLQYLEQAVKAGYGPALDTYAGLYLHGDFMPKDICKAKMFYEISARRGYGPSQFNYGIICKNAEGVPLDLEAAYIFLSLASENYADLGELTLDAQEFRDQVKEQLSPSALERAQQSFYCLKKEITAKKINND